MKRVKFFSFFSIFILSFCCYGDVQSEIDSGWQDMYGGDFTQARSIITNIISSDASSADKTNADLCLGWVDVFEAISNGQYAQAKAKVDLLKSEYATNWALGIYIFRTAEKMEWDDQLDIAKELYGEAKLLDDQFSAKVTWREMWIAIFQQIEAGNIDVALSTANQAKTQFSSHAELAEMLFRVGERLRWKAEYTEAKEFYAKSVEVLSEGRFARQSQFETLWVDTLSKMDSRDYESADTNINNMLSAYSDNNKMAEALYSFAERYRWAGYYSKVNDIYQKITSMYSGSQEADKASLDSTIVNTLALISPDNISAAETAINSLLAGLSDDPRLPEAMALAGEQYYIEGRKLENSAQYSQSEIYYQKALALWESLQSKFPDKKLGRGFYIWAGDCYSKVGRFED
ncbi:MAG: hypothetical protein KAS96_04255, partial [Planctomycetes bacterium]|nr:hypothetical protein [Planctomycetota bacterium]